VITVSELEAAIVPAGMRHAARSSAARLMKPLPDVLLSNGLGRRYEESPIYTGAVVPAAVAAAVDSSTSASVRAAECAVVAPESQARCRGPPPGLPPPVLEHKVSGSTHCNYCVPTSAMLRRAHTSCS
jgi:hypothetical protein